MLLCWVLLSGSRSFIVIYVCMITLLSFLSISSDVFWESFSFPMRMLSLCTILMIWLVLSIITLWFSETRDEYDSLLMFDLFSANSSRCLFVCFLDSSILRFNWSLRERSYISNCWMLLRILSFCFYMSSHSPWFLSSMLFTLCCRSLSLSALLAVVASLCSSRDECSCLLYSTLDR